MRSAPGTQAGPPTPGSPDERLNSWKDIASYLNRSVPTVQRWEREEQLPVHRLVHKRQGSVYAYKAELDQWWQQRRSSLADEVEAPTDAAPIPQPALAPVTELLTTNRRRYFAVVAAVVLGIAAVASISIFVLRRSHAAAPAGRVMLAVLPFQNLGGGPDLQYECDGLTEDLITELAVINPDQLGVIARTSAMTYKGSNKTVRDVGSDLGVQYVVEGSVRFAPQQARITAQLIRVSDQSHIWARSFEGTPGEMFKLEEDIAQAVADEVNVRVSDARSAGKRQATTNPEAYRLYVEGRQLWNKRSRADLERSIELYQEALKHDPNYARAYAGLADSFNMLGYLGFRPLGYVVAESQRSAQKALELDPNLPEAHAALGYINAMWTWDWKEAEGQYRRAIELDPGYVPAHQYYALYLASGGKMKEAEDEMAIAQRLDPLSSSVNGGSAYVLFLDRKYEDSLEYCSRALQSEPDYAVAKAVRGWDLVQLRRYEEGITALNQAHTLSPESGLNIATLARAYALAGQQQQADRMAVQLDQLATHAWVGSSMRAIIQVAEGKRDLAFLSLDAARKQEDWFLLWAKVTPEFDPLRTDPRYKALLDQLQLP